MIEIVGIQNQTKNHTTWHGETLIYGTNNENPTPLFVPTQKIKFLVMNELTIRELKFIITHYLPSVPSIITL